MVGSYVVKHLLASGYKVIGIDRCEGQITDENYTHIEAELAEAGVIGNLFETYDIDRVIHLAALAHNIEGVKFTSEDYYMANVFCSRNVFTAAAQKKIPVLFISTVDVYGFTKGKVSGDTVPNPVTDYGKSKYLAEKELVDLCTAFESTYDIYRFAPVYTDEIKRDIQKRYYLRYPDVAYIVGDGQEYEFLYIENACKALREWLLAEPECKAHNIKDEEKVHTSICIEAEQEEGRANTVLKFPRWLVKTGYGVLYGLTGKNKYTYLLNKLVNPIDSDN